MGGEGPLGAVITDDPQIAGSPQTKTIKIKAM